MEEKDLGIIRHGSHDHPLVLRESLIACSTYDGGSVRVYCNGCRERISSSSSSLGVGGGGGAFYTCINSYCQFLLHKRCAESPPKIKHPYHPEHALTLSPIPLSPPMCRVCNFLIDGFLYCCSVCDFVVHERCPKMALHIQDSITGSHIIEHPAHDHPLVLRDSFQGHGSYGGGRLRVVCDGCKEPISGAEEGQGAFYACPNSDCWYLLHKRCAELPPRIEHPSHPDHALLLRLHLLRGTTCDVCNSSIDGFLYSCYPCDFDVHICCASMALHIQDRVHENNKIHQHPLIPLEKEAQFLCDACGCEHKGKSCLCVTCGFWANQTCASAPTTVDLHSHPHPLTLFRSFRYDDQICKICNEEVRIAAWVYRCSKGCGDSVHAGCSLSLEEAENSNKDIQTKIPMDPKEDNILVTWPLLDKSTEIITQLIKNLSLLETHKKATKVLRCIKHHPLIFANKKIDGSKDDQLCDACAKTISSQFYDCAQCNFSLHNWCAELPEELQHILHLAHPLFLLVHPDLHFIDTYCSSCKMQTERFLFGCISCDFYLDLKCASLPRLIKHRGHDHHLALRNVTIPYSCNACGVDEFLTFFRCEACKFLLCIKCALLPFSVKHKYDKHPFVLTYSPIKGQVDEYYCEICEKDINSMYWFYHCIECNQSLHPACIYWIERD